MPHRTFEIQFAYICSPYALLGMTSRVFLRSQFRVADVPRKSGDPQYRHTSLSRSYN